MKKGLVLFIFLVSFVLLAVWGVKNFAIKQNSTPDEEEIVDLPTVESTLTLEPEVNTVSVGDTVTYVVKVEATNNKVVGVEAYFDYNPLVLNIISIEPTTLLSKPDILLKNISPQEGKITYAIGTQQPSTKSGSVFTIKAKALKQISTTDMPLKFDKDKTKVGLLPVSGNKKYVQEQVRVLYDEKPISILP